MGVNINEWRKGLTDNFVPTHEGPLRSERLLEDLTPGDVLDDGSLLTDTYGVITTGAVWLTRRKARAAAYYGWVPIEGMCLGYDTHTGETLYPLKR